MMAIASASTSPLARLSSDTRSVLAVRFTVPRSSNAEPSSTGPLGAVSDSPRRPTGIDPLYKVNGALLASARVLDQVAKTSYSPAARSANDQSACAVPLPGAAKSSLPSRPDETGAPSARGKAGRAVVENHLADGMTGGGGGGFDCAGYCRSSR